VIVAGHTHRPCAREKYGVRYYNTGDWVEKDHAAYVTIDKSGEIELIRM
jgi:UDP-2,3-diacylglucosamine pyrophosphatase LpxH